MTEWSDEEIDDIACVLHAELPDDSCKSQLGLLIYKEVLRQRVVIDKLAELVVTKDSSEQDIEVAKRQLIESVRTKYVS